MSGNTVLITDGTSGIGFELASQLIALGNTVIVTGRDLSTLRAARQQSSAVHAFQSDVSDPADIASLYATVIEQFPQLNMLVNNAGIMRKINLRAWGGDLEDLTREIDINLSGTVRVTVCFCPTC